MLDRNTNGPGEDQEGAGDTQTRSATTSGGVEVGDTDTVVALQREANYLRRRFIVFSYDLEAAAKELVLLRQEVAFIRSQLNVALRSDGELRPHVEQLHERLANGNHNGNNVG